MQVAHIFAQRGHCYRFCKKVDLEQNDWTWSKMISFKVVNNIAIPSYFASTFVKQKEIAYIISTLQMARAPSSLKSKVEIVLDVSCFNLAPCMAIMFHAHSLHLPKVTTRINNGGKFKQNIIIKCGWNATKKFYVKLIIVQISQFGASVGN